MTDRTKPTDGTREYYSASGSDAAPVPSGLLKGRYRVERELGRGGIGVVFLARDERLHSMPVVIKFLLDDSSQSAWLARKFMQEAEALTRINHPGVVRVIDRDRVEDGSPFFVMEFIKGKPLRSVMNSSGMDFDYIAALIRQVGSALKAAHCEGVFHRDLKPENIMLETLSSGDEQIKLIDFGIAKVRDSQVGATTESGMIAGSLYYISPEQLTGRTVSAASDIYALAIIVYEMVTGRRPFNLDSPNPAAAVHQLMTQQRNEQIVPPKQLRPSLPETAQSLILRALAFAPDRRPQDGREFGEELARALTGTASTDQATTLVANVQPGPQRAITETRRNSPSLVKPGLRENWKRLWIGLALAALVAAAVVGVAGKMLWPDSAVESNPPPAPSVQPVEAERMLSYWITVQKSPSRYPGSKPFQLPGEVIFSPDDRLRFSFRSPQTGYLYLINEGPAPASGPGGFNILFPSPTSNHASAQIVAGRQINIPERGDGFVMDEEEGTEKLWMVWSISAIDELEALKRWANPQDKGEIKDAGQKHWLRAFLTAKSTPAPDAQKNEDAKQTIITGRGDMLVHLIKLEHH